MHPAGSFCELKKALVVGQFPVTAALIRLATDGVIRGSLLRDLLHPFGPLRNLVLRCEPERSWLEIKAQFHVQARFVHSLQGYSFQPQVEDSLQAGKHSPVLVKNSSGDRQRILVAPIHLTKLEFFGPHMGNYGEVYSVRALKNCAWHSMGNSRTSS
jgi:hypothetical protein